MPGKPDTFRTEWTTFAVCAFILAAVLTYANQREYAAIKAREQERLTAVASVSEYMVETQLGKIGATLGNLRDAFPPPALTQRLHDSSGALSTAARLKILATAMTSVRSLDIIDASGAILASNLDEHAGQNAAEQEYFTTPRDRPADDVLYISRPFNSTVGDLTVNITKCLIAPDGSFAGLITASVDPEFFRAIMTAVLYAPNSWARLVHGSGTILLWVPERPGLIGSNLAIPGTFFTRHIESGLESALFEGKSYAAQEESLLILRTVQSPSLKLSPPLVLGVGRDTHTVFLYWRHNVRVSVVLFCSVSLAGAAALFGSQRWRRTTRLRSERMGIELQSVRTELESFFSISPNLLVIADLQGVCQKLNPAWEKGMGYAAGELEGQHCVDLFHPDDTQAVFDALADIAAGKTISDFVARFRHRDGSYRCLEWSAAGRDGLVYAAAHDITERKETERHLHELAYHDRLTGLPNRSLFFDRLSHALSVAKRNQKRLGILFLDLDGFKKVNDEHGHDAGDTVLKTIAGKLVETVRATDTVARMGGDEFVVILSEIEGQDGAELVTRKILSAVTPEIPLSDTLTCSVGASVGISLYPEHGADMDSLLMAADMAMYLSKKKGRNGFAFAGEAEQPETGVRLSENHVVGVGEIDEQHAELVSLVNRLCSTLQVGDGLVVESLFKVLLAYTEYHFATELRLMLQHDYPNRREHDAEHERLVRELRRFGLEMGGRDAAFLSDFFTTWLLEHILKQDKALGAFLRGLREPAGTWT
ncbi:bacteriohemerythrin [Desulfomicrobium salsuginis]